MSNLAFLDVFRRKINKTQDIWNFFLKTELFVGMSQTQCTLKEQSQLKNFRDIIEKLRKSWEKSIFCVKFDFVCGGGTLHLIAKRLGRPWFFIKTSHLSNIRVKSVGVVATARWVGVEWPRHLWIFMRLFLYLTKWRYIHLSLVISDRIRRNSQRDCAVFRPSSIVVQCIW